MQHRLIVLQKTHLRIKYFGLPDVNLTLLFILVNDRLKRMIKIEMYKNEILSIKSHLVSI